MSALTDKMKLEIRDKVFAAIESERDYQDYMSSSGLRPDIRPEFNMGTSLGAIKVNLDRAFEAWYLDVAPSYEKTMPFLRKVAALCVQAGESCGMPWRDFPCDIKFRSCIARRNAVHDTSNTWEGK